MSFVKIVPVRRDGTGRLVGVGLIEIADPDRRAHWTVIDVAALPGETMDQAIERGIHASLGAQAYGHLAKLQPAWITDPRPRVDGTQVHRHARRSTGDEAIAVELSGTLQPQSPVHRFSWFLVTALPAHEEIAIGARSVLADFLDAEGEFGLAARLRQN